MLRKSVAFKQSAPYQHLSADIKRLTERIANKEKKEQAAHNQ